MALAHAQRKHMHMRQVDSLLPRGKKPQHCHAAGAAHSQQSCCVDFNVAGCRRLMTQLKLVDCLLGDVRDFDDGTLEGEYFERDGKSLGYVDAAWCKKQRLGATTLSKPAGCHQVQTHPASVCSMQLLQPDA